MRMEKLDSLLLLFPLVSLFVLNYDEVTLCNGEQNFSCRESERLALLEFKTGLNDPHGLLSSWKDEGDCCQWRGIGCDNETGYVISINLGYHFLFDGPSTAWRIGGELSSSLLKLKNLNYLDLSFNAFRGISIPDFIGAMPALRYLNLSNAGFGGRLPRQLGNLSSLSYLDLNSFYSLHDLNADGLGWLSRLSSLRYLDMSSVRIGVGDDWFHMINMLPGLSFLRLSNCQLKEIPEVVSFNNLTSLAVLDLSNNQIHSVLPKWLFNMSSLEYLNLQLNHFQGSIPDAFLNISLEIIQFGANELVGGIPKTIGNLCNLRTLDLSSNNISGDVTSLADISSKCAADSLEVLNVRSNHLRGNLSDWLVRFKRLVILDLGFNMISGSIPASIGKLSTLKNLFLNHNGFNGTLPKSIGQLSELRLLDLSFNALSGVVSEVHFENNSKLEELSLASNDLTIRMNSSWIPPFHLRLIGLRLCKLGPKFPSWLSTQKSYNVMDLSSTGIEDDAPDWFWNLSQQALMLDLSHNLIGGRVPETVKFASISIIDLNSNKFHGPLPPFAASTEYLDFSNNLFTGAIDVITSLPILQHMLLSNNLINGTIPASICGQTDLYVLDLSGNSLSGELPTCWDKFQSLSALNLANNNLSGEIPSSMGGLVSLESLHLGNNDFKGELPMALENCRNLVTLDVGENSLSGVIPAWIGESLRFLRILRLRENMFYGTIPLQLSLLSALQILDLAHNGLSGRIPETFGNFTAMVRTHRPNDRMLEDLRSSTQSSVNNYGPSGYSESLLLVLKGRELEYSMTLQYVASIDLSSNNFTGNIPKELGELYGLQNLNLSRNHLTGKIPDEIGELKLMESLDLSWNDLSGSIPGSMSRLTSLSHLNLSYNNLSGRIPSGYQLQTLEDPYIYIGNPQLCGAPLDDCEHNETSFGGILNCSDEEGDCRSEKLGLYISIILGFITGFWVICGTLFISDTMRAAYFRFIDRMTDKLKLPCLKQRQDFDESDEQRMLRV